MTKFTVRFPRRFISFLGILLLGILPALHAEPSGDAVTAMTPWLKGVDLGQYGQSWQAAAPSLQKAESEKDWTASLTAMRVTPGAFISRKLITTSYGNEITTHQGVTLEGYFVTAQYASEYANLKHAVETVTFAQEGTLWKAAGYNLVAPSEDHFGVSQ